MPQASFAGPGGNGGAGSAGKTSGGQGGNEGESGANGDDASTGSGSGGGGGGGGGAGNTTGGAKGDKSLAGGHGGAGGDGGSHGSGDVSPGFSSIGSTGKDGETGENADVGGGGGGGGGGGAGGHGNLLNKSITNGATVRGGDGGSGGNGGEGAGSGNGGNGGDGGAGGHGVLVIAPNVTLTNGGSISAGVGGSGGNGGEGGRFGDNGSGGSSGASGTGIVGGNGLKIINIGNGTISGINGTNAITFTGGQNTVSFVNKTTSGITGNIANNGERLTFDQSSAVSVANVITGTGDVYKTGVGTLTLSGANSYSGRTNITGGTLSISADNNLGTAPVSPVLGKLTLGGTLETTSTMTLNSNRLIELNQGAIIKVNTGTTTYNGVISGVFGNNLTKSGSGTLLLGGNNTYTGVTSILGGTLQMGTTNALAPTSGVKVNSADGKTVGLLDLNGNNTTLGSLEMVANDKLPGNVNAVSGAGTLTVRGSISLLSNTTASSAGGQTTIAGTRLDLGGNTRTFNIASQGYNPEKTEADLTVSSIIQSGGVIIVGTPSTVNRTPATVHFTGANTYSGGTNIKKDSILFVNNNLGFGTGTVTVEAGGTAGIASGVTVANTFVLNGSGAGIGTPNAQKGAFVVYGAPGTAVLTSMLTLNVDGKISTPGGNVLQLNGGVTKTGVTATFAGGGTINVGTIGGGQTGISGGAAGTFNSDMVLDGAGTGGTGLGDGVTVLNLNVASNYSGPTTITNGGVLNANVIGALPSLAADSGIAPSRTLVIMDPSGAIPGSEATFPSIGGSVLNLGAGNPGVGVANQAIQSLSGTTSSIVNLGENFLTIGTASGTTEFAGVINSLSGGIIKDGASTQVLSGANTYTGTTVVQGGILQIGNGTAGNLNGASAVTVNLGSTLDINLGNSQAFTNGILNNGTVRGINTGGGTVIQTLSGVISGSGNFVQNRGATTIFSNINTYEGGTTISGTGSQLTLGTLSTAATAGSGAISIDNDGILNLANVSGNALSRNILNGVGGVGNVSVNSSNNNTLSGLLSDGASGTLAITQSGLGTTILTNNNSYTGQTNINAGTLQLGDAGVGGGLSAASNIINNGILDFQGANATPYANVISGSGAVAKGQTNTLILSGANSYEGLTRINTGTLVVGNASALGSVVSGTVVGSGTTLDLNGFNIGKEVIEIQGTGVGGLGALVNTSSSAAITDGAVTMLGNTAISTPAGRLTLNGVVSGGHNLTKVGSGTLFLNGGNDFTGQTFIDVGILAAGNASALGNTAAGTTVKDGASLMIGAGISTNSEPLTITGAGESAVVDFLVTPGALTQALNGSSTVNGSVSLDGDSTISSNGTGTLTLNGTIIKSAAVLKLTGGGTIHLNNVISGNTGSFNSDLVVNGATANLNAANTYLGPTSITSNVVGDGVLNANVANALPTVGGRTSITMDASGAASSVLNIGGSSLLLVGANQSIGSIEGKTSSKVTLGSKTLTIGFGQGSDTFGANNANFAGDISGTGGLVKDQTSTQILSGTNTFTGPVSVNGGTLSLQNGAAIVDSVSVNVNNPGVLNLINSETIGSLAGDGNTTLNANTLTLGGNNSSTTYNGVISGTGGLTKNGSGILILNGTNNFTGQTLIDAGILAVGNASALGNITAGTTVRDGASLMNGDGISTNSEPLTISGAGGSAVGGLSVTPGALTQALNGSSTVNGSVSLDGDSTISSNGTGTLTLNGTIIKSAAVLKLTGGGKIHVNNVISGITKSFNSDLVVNGATANLNAANTYLGPTFITSNVAGDGVLNANVANALPSVGGRTSITMDASGAGSSVLSIGGISQSLVGADQAVGSLEGKSSSKVTLGGKTLTIGFGQDMDAFGTNNANFAGDISGTGGLVKDQASTQILSGTNTFTGPVSVNGGTLSLQNGASIVDGVSVNVNSSGVLNLINSETIGSLAGDGNTTLNANTLTLGGNNSSTTHNGVISGTGGLTKNGSGILILNGINNFTGDTRITAGSLVIGEDDKSHASAQVGGSLYNDATLAGHGAIQGNVYNYGTLAPGYSTYNSGLGTLQVMGDYQGQNGFLDIQLDSHPGSGVVADQLTIAGTANLSGTTLLMKKSANELNYGEQVQIIDANTYGGQVDLFDISQFTNQMFFDNSTGIVFGTGFTQQQTLADMDGLNTNQINIAKSLASALVQEHGDSDFIDENLPLDAAVISIITDFDNSRTKIDGLSPEAYASFADYGIHVTRSYTRTAMNISETPRQSSAVPASNAGSKEGIATRHAPELGNTSVFGGFSHYDVSSTSSHNNADYDLTSTGGVMGFRHDVLDYSFGGFIGHDHGDVSSNYVNADVKGPLIGGFAKYRLNDARNCTFDGGVTYGDYGFDGSRQSAFGNTAFNGGDTSVFHVFTSVKGDLYKAEKLRLSPSLGLHYLNAKTDSILENGIGTALNVDGMRNEALLAELDFKVEYKVVSNFLLTGSMGYTQNFVDGGRDVSASFVAGGSPFNVTAPGLGNNILSTSIGASWQINETLNIGTGYRAEFSSDSNFANSVGIGASYSF